MRLSYCDRKTAWVPTTTIEYYPNQSGTLQKRKTKRMKEKGKDGFLGFRDSTRGMHLVMIPSQRRPKLQSPPQFLRILPISHQASWASYRGHQGAIPVIYQPRLRNLFQKSHPIKHHPIQSQRNDTMNNDFECMKTSTKERSDCRKTLVSINLSYCLIAIVSGVGSIVPYDTQLA